MKSKSGKSLGWKEKVLGKLGEVKFRDWRLLIFLGGILAVGIGYFLRTVLLMEIDDILQMYVLVAAIIAMGINSYWQRQAGSRQEKAIAAQEKAVTAQKEAVMAQKEALKITSDSTIEQVIADAVTHLSNDKSVVARESGVLSLYKLAQNDKQSIQRIHKLLSSHIRENSKKSSNNKISDDIQLALDMLTVREEYSDTKTNPFINIRLDLCEAHLQGAVLICAQLHRAILSEAHLQGADLQHAQLQEAFLMFAQLQGADLTGAQLQGAYLQNTQLQGADLTGAQLQGADLIRAQLQGANLMFAQLQGARLQNAQLQGAYLMHAQLQRANLNKMQLQGAYDVSLSSLINKDFQTRIKNRTNKETALDDIPLSGGITQREIADLKKQMQTAYKKGRVNEDTYTRVLDTMKKHTNKPKITAKSFKEQLQKEFKEELTDTQLTHEMARRLGFTAGSYTEAEAEKWIEEYEEAMKGISPR